jgi:hypothetical protein
MKARLEDALTRPASTIGSRPTRPARLGLRDTPVYDAAAAERHWPQTMVALFDADAQNVVSPGPILDI